MKTAWVDFKQLKEAIDMQMVLDHYGVDGLKKVGDELRGPCPIHQGSKKSKNFTVNIRKNAFKCFSSDCGARGNVLDFVAAMERCSVRDGALKLKQWFAIGESETVSAQKGEDDNEGLEISRGIYTDKDGALFEVVASALSREDFEALVVYRELSGEYRFWVTRLESFVAREPTAESLYTLVKAL